MDLKKLLNKNNPVIFDIGCNDGGDTARFCKMFPKGKFYAFEPDPRAIRKTKSRNLPVQLFEGLVSDIDGNVKFYQSAGDPTLRDVDPDWDKSGSILVPHEHLTLAPWITFPTSIIVRSIRLDTFVKQNNIELIDFIWADVQGAEELMIAGGRDTFDNKVKYLYTEYSPSLYEGSPSKDRILELLPDYELVELIDPSDYLGDMLLRNKRFDNAF